MTTHTEAQESYMAEEIAAIVHDLGFKALIERDDDGDVTIVAPARRGSLTGVVRDVGPCSPQSALADRRSSS